VNETISFLVTRGTKPFGDVFMFGRPATLAPVEFDRPSISQTRVEDRVIAVSQYRKVFNAVVERIAVDVMNVFICSKRADLSLSNVAMLINPVTLSKLEFPIPQFSYLMQSAGTNWHGSRMADSLNRRFESLYSQKRIAYFTKALVTLTRIIERFSIFPSSGDNWSAANAAGFLNSFYTNTNYKASA
jgi:hypothetical protein